MELKDLYTILNAVYPTAYWSFPKDEAPALPYITFFESGSDNFGADNKVYSKHNRYSVELLCLQKDPDAEAAVEAALDANELYWEKTEVYLEDEKCFEIIYDLEV